MQAIVTAIVNAVIGALPKLVGPLIDWVRDAIEKRRAKSKINQRAKSKIEKLKEASSEKDIDSAVDDL